MVDQMIPILFRNTGLASQIYVSDKFRNSLSPRDVHDIQRSGQSIDTETVAPWIAITLDLGAQDQKSSSTFPTVQYRSSRCLRIYAAGSTAATFPFLRDNELEGSLNGILNRAGRPPPDEAVLLEMEAQVEIGSRRDMRWEGKLEGDTQMEQA
jgi:hypothetical protein